MIEVSVLELIIAEIGFMLLGSFCGAALHNLRIRKQINSRRIGNIRIDDSDMMDGQPLAFLEIYKGKMGELKDNSFVILRVIRENYISRE